MFEDGHRGAVAAALDAAVPGSVELGALEYVERLLAAFDYEPPRIWAGPEGGPAWLDLGPWERHAWRQRIAGWQAVYGRVADGTAADEDRAVVHAHACEAVYGDPAYGGNRAEAAWQRIDFPRPLHPPQRAQS